MLKIYLSFKSKNKQTKKPNQTCNKSNNCMMALNQGWLFNGSLDFQRFDFLLQMSVNRNHLSCHTYEEIQTSLNKGECKSYRTMS